MNPQDIRSALKKAGYSLTRVANEIGLQSQTVGQVIDGRGRSQRVEQRVAELTGYALHRLWPDWHQPPAGEAVAAGVEPGQVDPTLLNVVATELETELDRRFAFGGPFKVRVFHVGRVYNNLPTRDRTANNIHALIAATVNAYIDALIYPGSQTPEDAFLQQPVGATKAVAAERTVINSAGAHVGRQINLTGNKQTLVMGNKIKKQTVTKK